MLKSTVIDKGSGVSQRVFDDQSAYQASLGIPPFGEFADLKTFRDYFRDGNGSNNMSVAGATPAAPIDFFVKADPGGRDRWIKSITWQIAASNSGPDEWGNGAALTDPIIVFYEQPDGDFIIIDDITTNYDVLRLAREPSFGNGPTALKIVNAVDPGNLESYIPAWDFQQIFGMPYGIRLAAGSEDRLVIRLQADTTAAVRFNAVAYGMDRGEQT